MQLGPLTCKNQFLVLDGGIAAEKAEETIFELILLKRNNFSSHLVFVFGFFSFEAVRLSINNGLGYNC